jgi:hypothetical protein
VGALAHYLEAEGIATTQVSLVREHTAALAPPRALWVPFMLGRPFGAPGDVAFQRRVLLAALRLLERAQGPVLEDFPQDAPPDAQAAPEGLSCPVSFPTAKKDGDLVQNLSDEFAQLRAWHALATQHRARTTLGVSGLQPDALVAYVSAWLSGQPPAKCRADLSEGEALKHACDELRAYYTEAKAMQPGRHSTASMQEWFWRDTAAGAAIAAIRKLAAASSEPSVRGVAVQSLVPRSVEAMLSAGNN